jgi:hypothetical protein
VPHQGGSGREPPRASSAIARQAEDVLALLKDRERRQKRELERAHMLMKAEASLRNLRGSMSREMQRAVFERDGVLALSAGAFSAFSTTT